ncbi:TKL protein kinase [Saprolegnia diclina VS20]|uniref:TKL protein kinase n=1 Tax=Saprolegnia diclina (strain VS20) TaxID=1156394 RepID=T0RDT9_SAPDV|nr:TKL protein kinase [Saprolegnia diclina VS20]EQC27782.1 TKL protein kinase [Saprolegnia diclina VS20]|eukprot:XP_008618712.1 TKL protein kinase [Saprolegnia diclina VS20]
MADGAWKSIRFDELRVGEKIGGGGVGIVYSGTYRDQPVALKTLFDPRVDQALKDEYMDELLVMSKLQHPHVVHFIGACMEAPNLCFVMELCNMSLFDRLHRTNLALSVTELVEIATGVADAMKYLHAQSPAIIHRDLKSQNVLLDMRGVVKLCDFGLVCTKETTAGTPAYMPPELLAGRPFSKAVDVYMYGVLLWELFARDVPFRGYDVDDIQRKVLNGDRPQIPTLDCPQKCQDLIRKCWDHEPARRPSFETIHATLREIDCATEFHRAMDHVMEEDALDCLVKKRK